MMWMYYIGFDFEFKLCGLDVGGGYNVWSRLY